MANESVEITQNPNEVTVTQSTNSASVVASNPRAGLGSGGTVQGSLNITQNLDVDGVLETDALTLNGVSLSETIQDVIGAMVAGNTETGIAVSYDDSDGTLDFVVASQTDQNFTNADHTKLDGIETGATADQTAAEIRTLVGSASDSNVFTDADHSKLDGIDANADVTLNSISAGSNISIDSNGVIAATDTQLSTEAVQDIIGAMVASNTETGIAVTYDDSDGTLDFAVTSQTENDFTTALKNKLDAIEANATADQTAAEIRTLVESASDSNVFTDADHTKLNSVASNADVTPSWVPSSDPSYATQSYVGTQVSNLVDSAPAALDTLNELAAALGDDANFSTTVTNSIAAKLPLAGGTMTGNIVMSGSETVDGRDLSVDGAKLDGIEASATADQTAAEIRALVESASDSNVFTDADHSKLNAIEASADVTDATNVSAAGALMKTGGTMSGDLNLDDDVKLQLGGDNDLQIYHDESNSIIKDNGTGGLFLLADAATYIQSPTGESKAKFTKDSGVELYFDNAKKFQTVTGGIDITGAITVSGTVDGRDVAADGTKLDGIESGATADQTAAEIRALVESASDSNVFTDADHSKLDGIEASATADQTATEIRALVDSASDSNVFTDADHTKLDGIESSATADQTAAEIRTLVDSASDSNVFTDADHTKLDSIDTNADVTLNSISAGSNISIDSNGVIAATNTQLTNEAVQDIVGDMVAGNTETGIEVTYDDTNDKLNFVVTSQTDQNFTNADHTKLDGIETGATADQTAAEIRTLVGSASDSNVFTDADHTKLDGISSGADVTPSWVPSSDPSYATESYVGTQIATVIDSAPAALDTLNELAAAMGDDANFSTTVTNSIATKVPLAGGTMTGHLKFGDSVDARFGASDDLMLGFDGTNATMAITEGDLRFIQYEDNKMIRFYNDDGTGGTVEYLRIDGSAESVAFSRTAHFTDNVKAAFGASHDLTIYHNASLSYIRDEGTGGLHIQTNGPAIYLQDTDGNPMAQFTDGGSSFLMDNGATKFRTAAGGVEVTGNIVVSGTVDGRDLATDGTKLDGIAANADVTLDNISAGSNISIDSNGVISSTDTQLTTEAVQDIVGAMVSSNTESGIAVTYDDTNDKLNFSVTSQTDQNFTDADHTKLDGIETGATADQTAAEIRTLVGNASDSNVFTDADHSKLDGIEASATADQTAAEIRTLVGSASDSNVFTDADHSKLDGIEASATADQTAAEIRTLVGSASDSNVFTDADHSKLDGIEAGATADQDLSSYATQTYVTTQINNLIDSSPAALDTLNELAAAINDDANFSTTITNSIATKLPLAGGTLTGVLKLPDGAVGAPALSFANDADSGIYWDNSNSAIRFSIDGTQRAYFSTAGILSVANVYTGNTGQFRNYGGTWKATTGLTGNGFEFNNSVDGTAMTLSSSGNLDVGNNITLGGTVDGRDVATDGTKLDGIESGATADQTAAEIRTLVGSASDSNVFTDADHSKLDGIEASATADQTAAEIRTLVGSASDSNVFTDADHSKLDGIEASATADQTAAEIRTLVESASDSNVFTDADHSKLDGIEASATADQTASEILTLIKTVDGSGSGLDADTLDGISSASFVRADTNDNTSSSARFTIGYSVSDLDDVGGLVGVTPFRGGFQASNRAGTGNYNTGLEFVFSDSGARGQLVFASNGNNQVPAIYARTEGWTAANGWHDWYKLWHAGNDGSGSGLDADTLDGSHASAFQTALTAGSNITISSGTISATNTTYSVGDGGLTQNNFTDADHSKLDGIEANATADQTAAEIRTLVGSASDSNVFTDADHTKLDGIEASATADQTAAEILTAIKTVDGSGSGLDADTVDGVHSSSFPQLSSSNSFTNSYNEFGNNTGAVSNDGSWNARVNISGTSHARLDLFEDNDDSKLRLYVHAGQGARIDTTSNTALNLGTYGTTKMTIPADSGLVTTTGQGTLWGSSNDGAGSGLDADTLDGSHASSFVTTSGDSTISGSLTIDDLTLNGSNISDAGDFYIDAGGDITIDADGGDIILKDGGTIVGTLSMNQNGGNFEVRSRISDKDLVFKGVDDGTEITALNFDMSDGGAANFGGNMSLGTGKSLYMSGSNGLRFLHDGTDGLLINSTGDFKFSSSASDKDIIFRGNDGGSMITALTLDMSAGGDATFANNIIVGGTVDGRDVASDGSKLDGIEAGATADQDLSSYATQTYVNTQISNLVDSSPAALDTLNELAAAINDDANFSTTITNSIATKLPLAGGALSGNLVMGGNQIKFADSGRLRLGDGNDLDLYHDGSNSKIEGTTGYTRVAATSGVLYLDGNNTHIRSGDGGETQAKFIDDGAVELYFDNQKKFETSNDGIKVTHDGGTGALIVTDEDTDPNFLFLKSSSSTSQVYAGHEGDTAGATFSGTLAQFAVFGGVSSGQGTQFITGGGSQHVKMTITHDGKIGMGTTSINSGIGLQVQNGDFYVYSGNIKADNINAGYFSSTRDLELQGGSSAGVKLMSGSSTIVETDSSGASVTGNITVSGTVDGRDLATDGTKLDGIEASADVTDATNVSAAGALMKSGGTMTGTLITTRLEVEGGSSAILLKDTTDDDDHSITFRNHLGGDDYKIATKDFTSASTGDGLFIGSETTDPVKLVTNDTIALTLDSSQNAAFAGNITVSGTVDGRDVASDGSKLDGIESGATADQTAGEIKTLLQTVDGSGSSIDADLLDSKHLADIIPKPSQSDFADGTLVTTSIDASTTNGESFVIEISGKSYSSSVPPHMAIAQGYLYNDTIINYSGVNLCGNTFTSIKAMNNNGYLSFWWPRHAYWNAYNVHVRKMNGTSTGGDNEVTSIANSTEPTGSKKVTINLAKTWNSYSDGAGSGLDADTLDGSHASAFQTALTAGSNITISSGTISATNTTYSVGDGGLTQNNFTDADHSKLDGIESNATADQTATEILTAIKTVDGGGSGLDADTLDGLQNTSFLRSDADDTVDANITFGDGRYLRLGTGTDTSIYHDSSNTYIDHTGTGNLVFQDSGSTYFFLDGSASNVRYSKDAKFSDAKKAIFGTDEDLQIYHDSGNSFITSATASNLLIQGDTVAIRGRNQENMIVGTVNSHTKLYHDNSERLSTTSDGISVSGNGYVDLPDNGRLRLGTNNDMMFYHNGSSLSIQDFQNHDGLFRNLTNDKLFIFQTTSGDSQYEILRLGGSGVDAKFSQHVSIGSSGTPKDLTTYGSTSARYMKWDGSADLLNFMDNVKITIGNSNDLHLYHDGSNSYIANDTTGDLYIQQNLADKDIILQSDDGSGGTTAYLTLDGSAGYMWASKALRFADGVNGQWGSSADLVLRHNGTTSYIENYNGNLDIKQHADDCDINFYCDDGSGNSELYFFLDGDRSSGDPYTIFPDNSYLGFGDSANLLIRHTGLGASIQNNGGDISITQNTNDGDIRFYSDDGSGGVSEYFRVDGGASNIHFSKELRLVDGVQIQLGTDNDMQVTHNGATGYVKNVTGDFRIEQRMDDGDMEFYCDDGSGSIAKYFHLDGGDVRTVFSKDVRFLDNVEVGVGTNKALAFEYNGANSYISNLYGDLYIDQHNNDGDIRFNCDDGSGGITEYFRLDGGLGYSVASKQIRFNDSISAAFGTDNDFGIDHNGTDGRILNYTGDLIIANNTNDKDIIFQSDDGSGGTTQYFRVDGSSHQNIFSKEILLNDGVYLKLGGGSDLNIWHDATDSNIQNNTGDLYIKNTADDKDIIFQSDDGSGGVATYFRLDGSFGGAGYPTTLFPQNSSLRFGNSGNLQIINDGTDSYIQENNGDLYIRQSTDDGDIILESDNGSGGVTTYLQLDGGGVLTRAYKNFRVQDDVKIQAGSSGDLDIKHTSNNSYIENITGDLYINNTANDKDILFRCDDGSNAMATYFKLDGSAAGSYTFTNWVDNAIIAVGSSLDAYFYHASSTNNTYLENNTGDFYITNGANDKDIIFQCDDSSGGKETYFFLDGSVGSDPITKWPDNSILALGTSGDYYQYHDGSNTYLANFTGHLYIDSNGTDKDVVLRTDNGSGGLTSYITCDGSATAITLHKGTTVSSGNLEVSSGNLSVPSGNITGYYKDFLIEHPTQEGKTLRHGCLEGPEYGAYFRGKSSDSIIECPEYWMGLVEEDSVTVQLTAIGPNQNIYVDHIDEDGNIHVGSNTDEPLNYYYMVNGERKGKKIDIVEDA